LIAIRESYPYPTRGGASRPRTLQVNGATAQIASIGWEEVSGPRSDQLAIFGHDASIAGSDLFDNSEQICHRRHGIFALIRDGEVDERRRRNGWVNESVLLGCLITYRRTTKVARKPALETVSIARSVASSDTTLSAASARSTSQRSSGATKAGFTDAGVKLVDNKGLLMRGFASLDAARMWVAEAERRHR